MTDHKSARESAERAQAAVGHAVTYHDGGLDDNGLNFSDSYGKIKKPESSDNMPSIKGLQDPATLPKSRNT